MVRMAHHRSYGTWYTLIMTEVGKSLREIRREQARERRKMKEDDLRTRERITEQLARNNRAPQHATEIRRHNAVVKGLVPQISAAIDSWAKKRVPLSVGYPAVSFSASTDFNTIVINLPQVEGDLDMDYAGDLRGLAYHEAGHILKSTPFPTLLDAVLPADSPSARRTFMHHGIGLSEDQLHHAWNVLEDQRMESAMVRESKNLAKYYSVTVLTHVLKGTITPTIYLLLYGRKYLNADVREAARTAFVQANSEVVCQQAEALIDGYKRSNTFQDMWSNVVGFGRLVNGVANGSDLNSVDTHEGAGGRNDDEDDLDEDALGESAEPEEEGDGKGRGHGKPGKGDSGEEEGDGDEADEEGSEKQHEGTVADRRAEPDPDAIPDLDAAGASESINDPDWERELLRRALEEAKEQRRHDQQIVRDVRAYNEAMHADQGNLLMERIPYLPDPDPTVTTEALRLQRALRNIMEQARAQVAPSWQGGQRRGVLDVRSYVTRQPGDMEFFRGYESGGDMHLPDMAVSLLLDGSGSMDHLAQELAVCAFGVKSACDAVQVPCTVTVYDTEAYLLWSQDERPTEVPYNIVPNGGTDPGKCLDQIDFQKYEKKNHLVIIMTDGQWQGDWRSRRSLAHYAAVDRDIVMFYLHTSPTYGPQGADTCSLQAQINDLQEIPRFLLRYLMRVM